MMLQGNLSQSVNDSLRRTYVQSRLWLALIKFKASRNQKLAGQGL